MAITLRAGLVTVTLPQGLIWSDEISWTPVAMETTYSITGALIVERAEKQAGRPITLIGGRQFTWISRTNLISLHDLLQQDNDLTLTLHDARTFTVRPTADPLQVSALPIVQDSGPANPSGSAWYVLESLNLIEV
jgi:hypothetical protein